MLVSLSFALGSIHYFYAWPLKRANKSRRGNSQQFFKKKFQVVRSNPPQLPIISLFPIYPPPARLPFIPSDPVRPAPPNGIISPYRAMVPPARSPGLRTVQPDPDGAVRLEVPLRAAARGSTVVADRRLDERRVHAPGHLVHRHVALLGLGRLRDDDELRVDGDVVDLVAVGRGGGDFGAGAGEHVDERRGESGFGEGGGGGAGWVEVCPDSGARNGGCGDGEGVVGEEEEEEEGCCCRCCEGEELCHVSVRVLLDKVVSVMVIW